jgi:hypothetical protein
MFAVNVNQVVDLLILRVMHTVWTQRECVAVCQADAANIGLSALEAPLVAEVCSPLCKAWVNSKINICWVLL